MDKEAVEETLRTTVNILYWQSGFDQHQCIQLACPTFPYFALSECSTRVQVMILGIWDDGGKLIETFDPAQEKWVTHEASMPRDLSLSGRPAYVLYRDHLAGAPGNAPDDMEVEVRALLERTKHTRKRLRSSPSIDELPIAGPSKRQKGPLPRVEPSSNVHPAMQTRAPELQHPAGLASASSSAHARWPLKYVCAMAVGFDRMASAPGTQRQKFEAAFNLPFPSKATYYANLNLWNAAHEELQGDYCEAGYSDAGLWKNFRRDAIAAQRADGNAAARESLTMLNGGAVVKTEIPELQTVKREVEVIYVLD